MRGSVVTGLLIAILIAVGCGGQTLAVEEAWARPAITGGTGGVYFAIDNPTSQPDILLSAASDVAGSVELHMSMMQEDGAMTMAHQDSVPVPANDRVEFKPGGLHVMLIDLNRDLTAGERFQITLQFQNAGEVSVEAEVKEP
jgi:copper(I)-binding protein